MKLGQIVISDLTTVRSSQINPSANCIFIVTSRSCYSSNTTLLWKQRQRPQNFIHRSVQVEKGRPSTLTKAVSTSLTAKKCYVMFAISFLENYVPFFLLSIIRTTFVPAPECRCIQIRLRNYSPRRGESNSRHINPINYRHTRPKISRHRN